MHTRTLKLMACLLAALTLTLAACRGPEADPAAHLSPEARARTVPIVRPLKLVPMEKPLVVEFEALPPGPNASSTLSIGIRVRATGTLDSAGVTDRIKDAGLPVQITLMRIEDSREIAVRLIRDDQSAEDGQRLVPVPSSGMVPGAVRDTVDSTSLGETGAAHRSGALRFMAFAWAPDLTPGRYRLSFRLLDPPKELAPLKTELLLAYQRKPK